MAEEHSTLLIRLWEIIVKFAISKYDISNLEGQIKYWLMARVYSTLAYLVVHNC